MSRFFNSVALTFGLLLLVSVSSLAAPPALVAPLRELFSHPKHKHALQSVGKSCTDCHTFSARPSDPGPVGEGVPVGVLKAPRQVCHECHLGKTAAPSPKNCALCHSRPSELKPASHHQNWKLRHGSAARMDSNNCAQCHAQTSCSQCHLQRDVSKPSVHRPNFRMTHSIEARANPVSCASCHVNTTSCVDCHTGRQR